MCVDTRVRVLNCSRYKLFEIAVVFTAGETACQDQEEGEGNETEAELDELLKECAGEVLVNFGNVVPPEDFVLFFRRVLPLLLGILVLIFPIFRTDHPTVETLDDAMH